jgi:hypothetical protein
MSNTTMGMCIEESLQPFHLRVSGASGCNHYSAGEPAACSRFECCSSDREAATLGEESLSGSSPTRDACGDTSSS